MLRRLLVTVAGGVLLAGCAAPTSPPPQDAVGAAEARSALATVARLAAQRSEGAAVRICADLADSCDGMSSAFRAYPRLAPLSAPEVVCDLALPALPGQRGPRLLVVTGVDSAGDRYVGQVLVLRRDGRPVLHEPAYWEGIRYTALTQGRAWTGTPGGTGARTRHEAAVRRACADPDGFVTDLFPETRS